MDENTFSLRLATSFILFTALMKLLFFLRINEEFALSIALVYLLHFDGPFEQPVLQEREYLEEALIDCIVHLVLPLSVLLLFASETGDALVGACPNFSQLQLASVLHQP